MCGIAGFIDSHRGIGNLETTAKSMTQRIVHRGPDSDGHWFDTEHGVALGHRRLSIVDLSPAGAQPMTSHDGRYVMVYNGEIYNHNAVRKLVDAASATAIAWRGHSDTEVMLEAFSRWGVEASLKKMVGMWAFALWDRQEKTVTFSRDRMGEKPLYFGYVNGALLFGSELKSFTAFPGFNKKTDLGSLALMLRYSCVGGTRTIYEGIQKLAPATSVTFTQAQLRAGQIPAAQPYWSLRDTVEAKQFEGSPEEAVNAVEKSLSTAIADQMMADVPVGAFLSGGIDSSTVVALMQKLSARPVRTFSIGFHEKGYNEAQHAKAVAEHLKTDHTELYLTADEMRNVVPKLPTMYDEPFADASQIPTFLVSQMTRKHVTVSLSGDAGDELFAGYGRHGFAQQMWDKINSVPRPLRRAFAGGVDALPNGLWDTAFALPRALAPASKKRYFTASKLHQLADMVGTKDEMELYSRFVSMSNPSSLLDGVAEPTSIQRDLANWPNTKGGLATRVAAMDAFSYLVDDILVKVDRASMAVSLESRVPMLDHRFVELAFSIPQSMKLRDGQSKWALRQVLYKHVPRSLVDRPKQGFGVPLGDWLRGPLREWAEAHLAPQVLTKHAPFNKVAIQALWNEHLSGAKDHSPALWNMLMFQAWAQNNVASS
jgi:asparagine synthase (glutamine-hydrolysing)